MAVPSITLITPDAAVADGTELAYVTGADFADNVEVRFGEAVAEVLGVIDEGPDRVALVRVPKFEPDPGDDPNTADPGLVDVSIQNLDVGGLPVPGEVDVSADAFTMTRTPTTQPSDLSRLIGQLILLLRREVVSRVTPGVAVDFDPDTGDGIRVVEVASTPAIILAGPKMTPAPIWRQQDLREEVVPVGPADVLETRSPGLAYHLEFALNLVTEAGAKRQLHNMIGAVGRFLNANRRLSMLKVDGDPDSGTLRWPMVAGQVRTTMSTDQRPNVAVWEVTILGVQIDSGRPLNRSRVVDDVVVEDEAL